MADEARTRAGRPGARSARESGPHEAAGERFGPYRVVEAIGAGGMGVVYRAVHEETGAEAAVKTVHVRDARYLASLRREIAALAHIRHPGVVPILDHGLEHGVPWYAMELVHGKTLRAWTRRRSLDAPTVPSPTESGVASTSKLETDELAPVPVTDAGGHRITVDRDILDEQLSIVLALCDTLAFLHGEGIVHRDLKPSNVLVMLDRRPVLVDFGLSARFAAGRDVLEVHDPWGTLAYMAPEQVRGRPVDARADLYSLGCILYELITGHVPATDREALLSATRRTPPPDEVAEGVPGGLSRLVMQLLEPSPQTRLGYASEVAAELRRLGVRSSAERVGTSRHYLYRPELVGRADVLSMLAREFARAQRGRATVVLVGGESGVGKTRLGVEFALRIAAGSALMITGECLPVRRAPLAPLSELLRTVADRCQQGGPGETDRLLGPSVSLLSAYEPSLAQAPGADPAVPAAAAPPGRATRARVLDALVRTTAALAADECVLLVLDDLQWADELTLGYVHALASAPPAGARLLVLGLYRSDETDERLAEVVDVAQRRIRLDRLDDGATREMVESVLCSHDVPDRLVASIAERAGGNPFYLAEYLQTAVEEGLLRREGDRWTAAGDAPETELSLPRGIRDLLEHRLARLSPSAQRVVEAAAVLGREADGALLLSVSPLEEGETLDGVTELLAHQIVEEHEGGTRFVHDQLREAAYRRIGEGRRSRLHEVAATALEARLAGGRASASELAYHFAAAGRDAQAVHYHEMAGAEALRAGGHLDAAASFQRALALDDAASRAHLSTLRRAAIERRLGDARFALGDLDVAAACCRRALSLLGQASPETTASNVTLLLRGVLRQAVHRMRDGSRASRATPRDEALLAEAALAAQKLAEVAYYKYQAVPLVGSSLLAVNLAERAGHYPEVARTYAMLGVVVGASGMPGLAERYFELAKSSAGIIDDLAGLVFAMYAETAWLIGMARWERVREQGETALALARKLGDVHEINVVETCLGHHAYFRGEHEDALARYRRVADTARRAANRQHLAWGLYAQARSLVRLARWAEAAPLCREAAGELADQQDVASEIICQGLLALSCERLGETAEADRALAEASARIRRERVPTMVFTLPGYAAVADVALGRWERAAADGDSAGVREARDAGRGAIRSMRLLAMTHPVAGPAAALHQGRALHLAGKRGRARKALGRALELARRLELPDEAARATDELGRST